MPTSRNVTTRDAAEQLGVHVRTLHRWVSTGLITPTLKVPGYRGAYLFNAADVERLAHTRKETSA